MAPTKERPATKTIATNREARHEYFVLEALETGVELKGTEVKSLRAGGVNLKDSWVDIEDGELLVKGMHITPYDHGNIFNQDPMRVRRLLAHKNEIRRLHQQCKLQGYTLVPLSLYFKHGRVKMELGLCKGKSSTTSVQMPPSVMPSAPSTGPLNPTAFTIDFRQHSCPETSKLTHTARCVLWGRKGFDGGSEAWAAGSSGGPALNSSKKLTDNNNYQLLAA